MCLCLCERERERASERERERKIERERERERERRERDFVAGLYVGVHTRAHIPQTYNTHTHTAAQHVKA